MTALALVFFSLVSVCCDSPSQDGRAMYECVYPRHPPGLQPSVLINIKEQSSLNSHRKKINKKQTNKQKTRHFLIFFRESNNRSNSKTKTKQKTKKQKHGKRFNGLFLSPEIIPSAFNCLQVCVAFVTFNQKHCALEIPLNL